MNDVPPNDQRREQRVDVSLQVKLRFTDVDRFRLFSTKDLSAGGIFVVSDTPKPIGDIVQVVLYPPGIELGLPLYGTVAHVVTVEQAAAQGLRAGMGLRFDDLDAEARESLISLMDTVLGAFEEARQAGPVSVPRPNLALPTADEDATDHEEEDDDDGVTIVVPRAPLSEIPVDRIPHGRAPIRAPEMRPSAPQPPPSPGLDRRAAPRVAARTVVRLRFADADLFRDFYTKDVSRGGLFVATPDPLAPMTEVELVLVLPSGAELSLEGRVVRTVAQGPGVPAEQVGMGIEFTNLTLEKRAEITRQVEDLSSRRSGGERLGRVKPVAGVLVRYESPADLQRVVRGDLRHRRLFVASEEVRPVGTPIVVNLQAPQLPEGISLQGEVAEIVERDSPGGRPGMVVRLVDLTDELLADLDFRVRPTPAVSAGSASKASKLADAAREDLRTGKRASAIANLKLALSFDPRNYSYKKLLDELVAQLPSKAGK